MCLRVCLFFPLQALSVAQLEALGPDNAAMLTAGQRAVLSRDQLAAVERAATGSAAPPQNPPQSGKKKRKMTEKENNTSVCLIHTYIHITFIRQN